MASRWQAIPKLHRQNRWQSLSAGSHEELIECLETHSETKQEVHRPEIAEVSSCSFSRSACLKAEVCAGMLGTLHIY